MKVNPEGKYVVDIDKDIDVNKCTPNTRVALRNDSYVLHKILPTKVCRVKTHPGNRPTLSRETSAQPSAAQWALFPRKEGGGCRQNIIVTLIWGPADVIRLRFLQT